MQVLLVHGSARAPAVQRLVRQLCGKAPLRHPNPNPDPNPNPNPNPN